MAADLPDYVASAQPLSKDNRVAWYSSIAPTLCGDHALVRLLARRGRSAAGINPEYGQYSAFAGGALAGGLSLALLGIIAAALICHFLFYLVPGMLGMKTGLPLYIVGTSTYGVHGGFLMPGFLMGLLQFGWLAVNAFFAGILLCSRLGQGPGTRAARGRRHGVGDCRGVHGPEGHPVRCESRHLPAADSAGHLCDLVLRRPSGGLGNFDAENVDRGLSGR